MSEQLPPSTIVIDANVSGAQTQLNGLARTIDSLGRGVAETSAKMDKVGQGATDAASKADKAAQATIRSQKAWLAQVENTVIAYKAAGDAATQYELRAQAKGIPADIYGPKIAQLRELAAAEKEAAAAAAAASNSIAQTITPQLNNMGMSAKATAQAMRMVPAQMTDIVVSLQSGQAPLTVLMQQGGQLKDMFGGVGNAAKALGGYILSLVNPYTVAAAAAAGLAVAYSKGAAESEAYNKALILTGNYAGTTAASMTAMAAAVSKTTGGTVGAAADALAQLAGNGTIAASQFDKLAGAAVNMEKTTGAAVADTVKQFAELGKEPLTASLRLNESTHFLTLSVYEQIKALTEQGRMAEAGALAQNAWADTINKRTPELVSNLGYLERAWNGVAGAAKGAWDSAKDIGRQGDAIASLQKQISVREGFVRDNRTGALPTNDATLNNLRQQLDYLREIEGMKRRMAESDQTAAKSVAAQTEFDKDHDKYLSKEVQMRREIALAAERFAQVKQTPANLAAYTETLKGIQEKFKEAAGPKLKEGNPFQAEQDAAKEWEKWFNKFTDDANNAEAAALGLSKAQKDLIDFTKTTGYSNMSTEAKLVVIELANAAIANEALAKSTKAYDDALKSIQSSAANEAESLIKAIDAQRLHNAEIGKTPEQVELAKRAEQDRVTEMLNGNADILQSARDVAAAQADFDAQTLVLWDEKLKSLREQVTLRRQLAGELTTGAALESANSLAKANKKAAEESGKYWEDALMRAFESGKGFFASLWDTIKNTLKTQVLKVMISATGLTGMSAAGATGTDGSGGISSLGQLTGLSQLASGVTTAMNWLSGAGFGAELSKQIGLGASSLINNGFTKAGTYMADAAKWLNSSTDSLSMFGSTMGEAIGNIGGYASALYNLSEGKVGSAIGAAIGTYFGGPIGAAIGSYIMGNLFGENQISAKSTGEVYKGYSATGSVTSNLGSGAEATKVVDALYTGYAQQAMALGIKQADATFGFASNTGRQGENPNFTLSSNTAGNNYITKTNDPGLFSPNEMAFTKENMSLEASRAILAALQGSELPKYLAGAFDGITVSALTQEQIDNWYKGATAIKSFSDSMQVAPWESFKDLGFAAIQNLSGFAGGIDKLQTSLGSFYDNFYTQSFKTDALTANTAKAFEALGIAMPAVDGGMRDWYRAMVESKLALDQSVPANAMATTAVLSLQDAVNTLAPAFDAAAESATGTLRALSDYGNTLRDSVNELRGQAVSNRDAAVAAFGQALTAAESYYDGLVKQQEQLNADINSLRGQAGQALTSAGSAAQSALRTIADANTAAQASLKTALQSVVNTIAQAATDIKSAQAGVDSAKASITAGYVAANDKVIAAQKALTDAQTQSASALKTAANDLFDTLRGLKNANVAVDYTTQKNAFEAIAAKALAGDAQAIGQLGSAGTSYLSASESGASTAAQYQRDDIRIRQVIGQVAQQYGGTITSTDPTEQLAKNLAAATTDLADWQAAVTASGAATTIAVDLLAEYNAALAALTTAQNNQADLLTASAGFDLSGVQASTTAWQDAVDAATDAQDINTAAAADFATAMSAASAAGVSLTSIVTPLQTLQTALDDLTTAQEEYDAVQGDLYTSAAGLVSQYATLNTDLTNIGTSIDNTRTSIDASVTAFTALGLTLPGVSTEIDNLALSLADLQTAQGAYIDMLGATYIPPAGLKEQYDAAALALEDFTTRTNAVDFSGLAVLDPLGDLLTTYANAVATLTSTQTATQQSYFGLYKDVADAYAANSYGMTKDEFAAYHYATFGVNEQRVNPNLLKPIGLAIGTNYVPYDGFAATLHQGEAVVPAAYNPALGGQARDEAVVNEIKALRAELAAMRADNRAADSKIESNTNRTAKVLERAMTSADSLNVTVVNETPIAVV